MNVNFYTPVVTAFDENGELDLQGNKNIYDHLIGGGIAGLLILGSSGEFYALNMEQKKTLIDMAVPYINKRAKVFFGTACDSMEETVELSNYAPGGSGRRDADQPYYFTIDDASIEAFYDERQTRLTGLCTSIIFLPGPDMT